jgi:hypothetical protein
MIEELKWLLRIGWRVQSTEEAYSAGDLMVKEVWINNNGQLKTVIFKPWF